jgi:hypothetical protein
MPDSQRVRKLLSQLGLSLQKIKFGGVVGKQTLLGVFGALALAVIAWRATPQYAPLLGIIAGILLLTVVVLNFVYANRHPVEATLEGAEMVAFHYQSMAAKNMPEPPSGTHVVPDPSGKPPLLNPPGGTDE